MAFLSATGQTPKRLLAALSFSAPQARWAGVDVRGSAPGTREIALLNPVNTVEKVNAVVFSGGSAFGLAVADGVMRWLDVRGHGYDVGVAKVPIVPAAILFDLGIGRADVRPDAPAGYLACQVSSPEIS
jgi:L-aminopeptidase/D-esterase-like protein